LNVCDVFTLLTIVSRISKPLHSLWSSTIQILQQGHPCSLQYNSNLSLCSLQNSPISKTNDGNFWYSEIGMVLWFREVFDKLWWLEQFTQSPWSHSGHQTSDGLEIWRTSHIPQVDGELVIMLISWNILFAFKLKLKF
jgi:hypothetical protein